MGSYRLGLIVIATTVALSSLLCTLYVSPRPYRGPAGEDTTALKQSVGSFSLIERDGQAKRDSDLADRVWVAAFVFSRCPSSCPRISTVMQGIQTDTKGTGIQLVSFTVDPDFDTLEVLRKFADRYRADPNRWLFLTGNKKTVHSLVVDHFLQALQENTAEDQARGLEAITHSDRLVLVAPENQIVGIYHSSEKDAVRRLIDRAKALDKMAQARKTGWVHRLPAVNASLNGTCAILLTIGLLLIRDNRRRAHASCMILAIAISALFLSCYLVYHYYVGSVAFQGVGAIRVVYLSILLSHTVLAVAVVPLIATTVIFAALGSYQKHRKFATVTFPIWMYVSITGVIVYLMLYQLPLATSTI